MDVFRTATGVIEMMDIIIMALFGLIFGFFLWSGNLPAIKSSRVNQMIVLIVIGAILLYFIGLVGLIVFVVCSFVGLALKGRF